MSSHRSPNAGAVLASCHRALSSDGFANSAHSCCRSSAEMDEDDTALMLCGTTPSVRCTRLLLLVEAVFTGPLVARGVDVCVSRYNQGNASRSVLLKSPIALPPVTLRVEV